MKLSKKRNRFLAAVWVFLNPTTCNLYLEMGLPLGEAFVGSKSSRTTRSRGLNTLKESRNRSTGLASALYSSSSSDGGNGNGNGNGNDNQSSSNPPDDNLNYWKLPNDFSMFLTQRSIQSFMFLMRQLRDPETCYWVEDFTRPNLVISDRERQDFSLPDSIPNLGDIASGNSGWSPGGGQEKQNETEADKRTCHLLRYHGLAAMDTSLFPTWETYFERLLEQPTDTWVISSDQSHIPDYTWEIDPASLCGRILSVREQLAREFARDLKTVSDMGGQTFDWYWEKLKRSRNTKENTNTDQNANHEGGEDEDVAYGNGQSISTNNNSPFNVDPSSLRGSRDNLLFLEINVDDPTSDHKPSPLRRSNFDLLVLLATEEAIHRVLNRWESRRSDGDLNGSEDASQGFLEGFYQERQHFFHGPLQSYGRADDFLEDLLDSALLFGESEDQNNSRDAFVINPTKIAELVLKERERVALDWMEIARESPVHHMRIQKLRLDRMMGGAMGGSNENNKNENELAQNESFDPGPGAFE